VSLNNEDFDLNMNAIEALLALDDVDSVGEKCCTVSIFYTVSHFFSMCVLVWFYAFCFRMLCCAV
jgi:hypothetical protein